MPKHTGIVDYNPDAGITKYFHRLHDGDWAYETVQDVDFIAKANEYIRNHGTSWLNKERDVRLDAQIPMIYRQKWIDEYGVDFLSADPDVQKKVDQILDRPEYRWMRTNDYRLA